MIIYKCDIFAYAIVLFPIFNLIGGWTGYYDEVIGLISLFYVIVLLIRKGLEKEDRKIFLILCAVTCIGLISNFLSKLTNNAMAVAVDILWLWKMYACFIAFRHIASNRYYGKRINYVLIKYAKFIIVTCFLMSLIGQVVDIGVTGKIEFGNIKSFLFFWNNAIQTGWLLFGAVVILAFSGISEKKFRRYLILAIIPMLLTCSSLVLCWVFAALYLFWMLNEDKLFKKRYLLFLALGVVIFTSADISTYILSESVRMTMLKYGAITANTYFPFGSGFATYGSEMAARYYSPLYIKYGWEHLWALGRGGKFLNDNFYASIIGQFGWIGFGLYLLILLCLLNLFNSRDFNKRERATTIATVITIAVVMIGSASAKSMMGVFMFAILGLASSKSEWENNDEEEFQI